MQIATTMKSAILLLCLSLTTLVRAQNLVPNPSFEQADSCPYGAAQWANIAGWDVAVFSPDYFNACSPNSLVSVPSNGFGYQSASHGDAYVGMINYDSTTFSYRELIGTALAQPLQVGVPVYLSFKVATGGFGNFDLASCYYTSKGVGMKFFSVLPATPWDWALTYFAGNWSNSAALYLDTVITDTLNWVTVSGTYVPDSAYQFLVLGNFFDDANSGPLLLDSTLFGFPYAYTFLDEICVSYQLADCGLAESVGSRAKGAGPIVWPNPFSESLQIGPLAKDGPWTITLVDPCGRVLLQQDAVISKEPWTLRCPGLLDGPYLLVLENRRGERLVHRVLHVVS